MLVTPLARSSLLVGRALKEIVTLVAQAAVIVLVMLPFGFRLHPVGSYALALAVRKQEWMFWMVHQTVLFPLMILSGMLLPLQEGPGWMRALARANPLTYVVEAERELFAGDLVAPEVGWGFVAAGLTVALGLAVGIRSMRHSD